MNNLSETIPAENITLNRGVDIFPLLFADLEQFPELKNVLIEREKYGIEKYGQSLKSDDNRDDATEIVNELCDCLAYMKKYLVNNSINYRMLELYFHQILLSNRIVKEIIGKDND